MTIAAPCEMKPRPRSKQVWEESLLVNPGGVNSPIRSFSALNMPPLVAQSASGDSIRDVDGNVYIDYCCSWGSMILGHAHPMITQPVIEQVFRGSSFGVTTDIEARLAKEVIKLVPSVEKIRFVSSGTEATMSAIRLARGYTRRDKVVKFNGCYHGHSDSLLVKPGSGATDLSGDSFSAGIPRGFVQETISLKYNDVEGVCDYLLEHGDEIACVIIEPVAANMGIVPATASFLQMLREVTRDIGALLIFDEVISGFRLSLSGAEGIYGISPDISCFGKIIGGGYPAAAFGGRAEIMDHLAPLGKVFQAGTLSGCPVAMTAGLATLFEVQRADFYDTLKHKADVIVQPVSKWLKENGFPGCIQQMGSLFTLFFGPREVRCQEDLKAIDHAEFEKFFKFLFERGIYPPPLQYEAWFVSMAHTTTHLIQTRDAILEYLTQKTHV